VENQKNYTEGDSVLRKKYKARLAGRCIVLLISLLLFIFSRDQFDIIEGFNFFKKLSLFHILWVIWFIDMILQLIPVKNKISLGSQKHLRYHFREVKSRISKETLKKYIVSTTKSAYKVMILWIALLSVIAGLYFSGSITKSHLLLITVCFYVFDLICVLIFCPFRLIMGNKCCTTCRIFNWDHLMMFSPMIFMGGFYAVSLVTLALLAWLVWELCIMIYPERFWDRSNAALKCSECTDKLCTQYCQKLRK
jgi:hypothetical protein